MLSVEELKDLEIGDTVLYPTGNAVSPHVRTIVLSINTEKSMIMAGEIPLYSEKQIHEYSFNEFLMNAVPVSKTTKTFMRSEYPLHKASMIGILKEAVLENLKSRISDMEEDGKKFSFFPISLDAWIDEYLIRELSRNSVVGVDYMEKVLKNAFNDGLIPYILETPLNVFGHEPGDFYPPIRELRIVPDYRDDVILYNSRKQPITGKNKELYTNMIHGKLLTINALKARGISEQFIMNNCFNNPDWTRYRVLLEIFF